MFDGRDLFPILNLKFGHLYELLSISAYIKITLKHGFVKKKKLV